MSQDGLPVTVPELVEHIKKQCVVQSDCVGFHLLAQLLLHHTLVITHHFHVPHLTDILSFSDSAASRSSGWSVVFAVPHFPLDCELQLEKANAAFKENGVLLDPDIRLKTSIFESLAAAIVQHRVYRTDQEFEEVAEAPLFSHSCLREPGSANGYGGWKVSLKYKLRNNRRKLKWLGCPEVEINSMTHKPTDKSSLRCQEAPKS